MQVLCQGLLNDVFEMRYCTPSLLSFIQIQSGSSSDTDGQRERHASSSLLYALSSAAMILISNRPSMVEKESGQRKGFGKHCNDL